MRDSGQREGGQRHLSWDVCAAERDVPAMSPAAPGCIGWPGHLSEFLMPALKFKGAAVIHVKLSELTREWGT